MKLSQDREGTLSVSIMAVVEGWKPQFPHVGRFSDLKPISSSLSTVPLGLVVAVVEPGSSWQRGTVHPNVTLYGCNTAGAVSLRTGLGFVTALHSKLHLLSKSGN